MIESTILTHLLAAAGGAGGIYVLLRYVAGWATAFENKVSSDIAVIKHALGIGSNSAQSAPVTHVTAAPIAGGGQSPPAMPAAGAPSATQLG